MSKSLTLKWEDDNSAGLAVNAAADNAKAVAEKTGTNLLDDAQSVASK